MGITLKELVLATLMRNRVTFTVFVRQPCFLYLFISCNSHVVLSCMLLAGPVSLETS